MKSVLVVAKNNQAEALRVAAGLTLLSAPVSVAVVGALADTPAITEQKEVLEFAEVPCKELGEGAEGHAKLARAIAAADHIYVI